MPTTPTTRSRSHRDEPGDLVNVLVALGAVVLVAVVSITAMLLVRRRAPEGSRFQDGDRASGVFGVLATGFSVLLGFIVFLAFNTYDTSRSGAEDEAILLTQQVETAQYFSEPVAEEITGELVCYGRSVVGEEWDRLESGTLGDSINPWSAVMFDTLRSYEPAVFSEQSAYDRFMDQTSARQDARNQRVHGVTGVIPSPLWIVLFFVSAVIFVFMLFFADSSEGAVTQAMLMGSVTSVITILLLLLVFFNQPFQDDVGGLQPDSMERALRIIDNEMLADRLVVTVPCDDEGVATADG
jgi:hypothetical protein